MNHDYISMAWPMTWTPSTDEKGKISWEAAGSDGTRGEVFLHLYGFEKSVPPIEEFMQSQRRVVGRATGFESLADQPISHDSGLPAHLFAWSSFEPGLKFYNFRCGYLQTPRAIVTLKLDQPGDPGVLTTELDLVFQTIRWKK
jgi:hypothetical protein